ncbi:4'-phosphopantetheinyl transferase EntD (siderophore biosynthesis) [Jatrophihabitans endophyticus]|uniref:4'-phosphopantetheinyl transferase EntD (Siderophore biosynthesis) n=2 Tax=Jatrophihabitans endophyticus TaxID=1206085 RepID=A0A1M5CP70_9ACTN|nr:4'-phosphopantetheinyl transferase EntD (siderophore biosynthesis) [Jatrophihabitans endophyticus]
MLRSLLPPAVAVAETRQDLLDELAPDEAHWVAHAVARRRSEFHTGRACARVALAELGIAPAAIPVGPQREPCWPTGVVGSITHCDGYRAAAAAPSDVVRSLGVDVERHRPLPDGVLDTVTDPGERATLTRLAAEDADIRWDVVLFSAKEAVFKTWFPVQRRWLGFEDATVDLDRAGTFTATVHGPTVAGGATYRGRWSASDDFVACAVVEPAS